MIYFEPDFDIYEEDEIDLESENENLIRMKESLSKKLIS
jgi:hypothetical protein